ncbi:MAG: ATP synthase F1 subunit delta [Pyrinomonadaceae bacterium]
MSIETVARRYGAALADVVGKSEETDTVKQELVQWQTLITSNADLRNVLGNPAIPHSNKEKILARLLEKTRPSKTTGNFLRVLLRNNRLTELAEINERFAAELESRSGVVSASVTSARNLNEPERKELAANIARLTSREVKLNFDVDGSIIGGVVTRIGSTVYDASVKTQLKNLREQMIGS